MTQAIQVLKFGSSVLPSAEQLHIAVHEIYRHLRQGKRVIAVTSAIGDTTDRLLHQAGLIAEQQNDEAVAELLATGETEAVALLKMALAKAGLPAFALTARCLALQTDGPLLDSNPVSLDVTPLRTKLESRPVLVVPGFVGCQQDGRLSLLGRGGSDLSALVIAHELSRQSTVRCRLLKDVPGLYQWDPAADGPPPRRYRKIGFEEAIDIGGAVLQPKAVSYAQKKQLRFELGQCGSAQTTVVGTEQTVLAPLESNGAEIPTPTDRPHRRLRVALWGLGTVGTGVYHYLAKHHDKFELVDLVAANPDKYRSLQPPLQHLSSLAQPLQIRNQANPNHRADVIVELAGSAAGFAPTLLSALADGTAVVTADKEFVANHLPVLSPYRNALGGGLRCSAAVAGVVPALERVKQVANKVGVKCVRGVLNGTTNYVLQQMADGCSYRQALHQAQQLGYAEADPSADVYGWDAARKLSLLIHQAWGVQLPSERIPCQGIATLAPHQVHADLRLVADAQKLEDGRIHACVKPVELTPNHPLLQAQGVGNVIEVEDADGGKHLLSGDGAGKWPTAEAVFADLLDLWRERFEWTAPDAKLKEVVA